MKSSQRVRIGRFLGAAIALTGMCAVSCAAAAQQENGANQEAQQRPITPLAHVEKAGNGPQAVVLIPGLAADWRTWDVFLEDFANEDRYTMYAVTLPGFGGSAPPPDEPHRKTPWIDNAVAAVAKLIEDEGKKDVVVISHASLGGFIAMRLGLERPDLVKDLILVDGFAPAMPIGPQFPPPEQRQEIVDMLAPRFAELPDEFWEEQQNPERLAYQKTFHPTITDMAAQSPKGVTSRYLLECMRMDLTDRVEDMSKPTLFMFSWPADMTDIEKEGKSATMKAASAVPVGDYVTVGRAKRFIMQDRPDMFSQLVEQFIRTGDVEPAAP
ncbi:MAG: alpha/beta hydrolase [Planctomycetota bacterium]|nr:alpha/beta hydrolase [Planctomycetota bacterium]